METLLLSLTHSVLMVHDSALLINRVKSRSMCLLKNHIIVWHFHLTSLCTNIWKCVSKSDQKQLRTLNLSWYSLVRSVPTLRELYYKREKCYCSNSLPSIKQQSEKKINLGEKTHCHCWAYLNPNRNTKKVQIPPLKTAKWPLYSLVHIPVH